MLLSKQLLSYLFFFSKFPYNRYIIVFVLLGGRGKRKLNEDKESNVPENGESSNENKSVNDSSRSTSLGIKPAANEDTIQNKR